MSVTVDLKQLAVRRNGAPAPTAPPCRPRHLLTRYVVPGLVLLGFVGVAAWAARDTLLPSRPVTVVPLLTARAEVQQEGTPLFQAAGWIEPRPTPVLVTALAEGVIDKLLVVEGQEVKAGQPVARLLDADARLALKAAEADLRLRQAEAAGAAAALSAARINVAQPVHLQAALSEAEATLAQKETELAGLPFLKRSARARHELARQNDENKARGAASGALPESQRQQARSDLETALATAEELEGREPRLKQEVEALRGRRDALRQRLELKTEENRQVADASAQVDAAEARLQQAQAALEAARLRLERMTIPAPASGRVLALAARPGMRVMGLAPGSLHDSSTVVTLYDPASLQVRADVRLEDVPRVQPGQAVKIDTAAASGSLTGEVLFATSQADIQKNTLQVKVAIKDPPAAIRPDMLVQVTFLAPPSPKSANPQSEPLRLLLPRQLVESGEGGSRVWIADLAGGVARQRSVKLGVASGELIEVVEGLTAADRVISGGREGLRERQRITVTAEDVGIGVVTRQAKAQPQSKQ